MNSPACAWRMSGQLPPSEKKPLKEADYIPQRRIINRPPPEALISSDTFCPGMRWAHAGLFITGLRRRPLSRNHAFSAGGLVFDGAGGLAVGIGGTPSGVAASAHGIGGTVGGLVGLTPIIAGTVEFTLTVVCRRLAHIPVGIALVALSLVLTGGGTPRVGIAIVHIGADTAIAVVCGTYCSGSCRGKNQHCHQGGKKYTGFHKKQVFAKYSEFPTKKPEKNILPF